MQVNELEWNNLHHCELSCINILSNAILSFFSFTIKPPEWSKEHVLVWLYYEQSFQTLKYNIHGLLVYCFVCHKLYKAKKSNYLNSHGEEAQEKPPGL